VELLEEVPPTVFVPQPKVSSSIVRLRPKSPPFEVVNENLFSKTVRVLFQHRRKKVRNALYHSFGEIFPDETMSKAEKRDLIRQLFPEELTEIHVMELPPEKFGEIANRLANMIEERDSPIP
jgi:16S rRNA (adenine1518-N6/adenine1519-N6)-dimethyltransferase